MKNRNEVLARLKAVGYGDVADALIAAKSAEERARVLEDAGIGLDIKDGLESVWQKKVTVTADAGEEIEVVGSEPAQAMAEGDMEEEGYEKSAPAPRRVTHQVSDVMRITRSAGVESRKGPAIRSERERAVKSYTLAASQGRVNPRTRKPYVYLDGDQAELAGAWLRLAAFGSGHKFADLYPTEVKATDLAIVKSHGINNPTLGAAFAPEEFSNQLIELLATAGAARRAIGVETMSGDTKHVPRLTGQGSFYELGEGAQLTEENQPTSDRVLLVAQKIGYIVRVSNELLSDSQVSVSDIVSRDIARAQGFYDDKKVITGAIGGNGWQQRVGANSTYDAALAASWADWTSAKLQAAFGKLGDRAPEGSVPGIVCSRQYKHSVLDNVALAAGGAMPSDLVNGITAVYPGADAMYNGFPVYYSSLMPKTYAADQISAYVGYFADAAKIAEVRGGLRVDQSDDRYFEYDEVAFRAINRIAVNNHDVDNDTNPLVVALQD